MSATSPFSLSSNPPPPLSSVTQGNIKAQSLGRLSCSWTSCPGNRKRYQDFFFLPTHLLQLFAHVYLGDLSFFWHILSPSRLCSGGGGRWTCVNDLRKAAHSDPWPLTREKHAFRDHTENPFFPRHLGAKADGGWSRREKGGWRRWCAWLKRTLWENYDI